MVRGISLLRALLNSTHYLTEDGKPRSVIIGYEYTISSSNHHDVTFHSPLDARKPPTIYMFRPHRSFPRHDHDDPGRGPNTHSNSAHIAHQGVEWCHREIQTRAPALICFGSKSTTAAGPGKFMRAYLVRRSLLLLVAVT